MVSDILKTMVDKLFKSIIILVFGIFLLFLIPIFLYLFAFQPLQLRNTISKYPVGAYVIVNKLSYRLGSLKMGDIIAFKSLKNPDVNEVGIVDRVEQDMIFVKNNPLPLRRLDVIGKISFCYSNCK